MRYYAGVDALADHLTVAPRLPHAWTAIAFKQCIRGITYAFSIDHHHITVTADQATTLQIQQQSVSLKPHVSTTITY
ncbi:hypothetical protein L3X07_13460 [Levilactobacillus brevis]|nr:hypothetical protein [Levilactobacillus brevis]